MPVLANAKHELFAQLIAEGNKSLTEAFELAGYKRNRGNAHTLSQKPDIAERVKHIKAEIGAKVAQVKQISVESLVAEAEEARKLAMESGQLSAAIAAIKEKGVLSGKRIERQEVGGPGEYEAMADVELERELAERIAQLGLDGAGSETQH